MKLNGISAVIITFNEGSILDQCLTALQGIVDEIIILDSYSTDNTIEIAEKFGCKIFQQKFEGFGKQKNDVIALANNDWVLAIDADEILSEKLQASIKVLQQNNFGSFFGYSFPLLNYYIGKFIKYGGWYPDHKPRLFNRKYGAWTNDSIHESWQFFDNNRSFGKLKGDILHYTLNDLTHHINKIEKYTTLSANKAFINGKNCSILKLILAPKWFFINRYFLRLGFLDGYYGYLFCKMTSFEKRLKYSKLRNLYLDINKIKKKEN